MIDLHYTEDRWFALHQVAEMNVMHHDVCEASTPGFSWSDTAMTVDLCSTLGDLLHAGLVSIGRHQPWGAQVFLTFRGSERLTNWNLQHAGSVEDEFNHNLIPLREEEQK